MWSSVQERVLRQHPRKPVFLSELLAQGFGALVALDLTISARHLHELPEPLSARAGRPFPEALERLVLDCLEKQPERRPQSAREFVGRLEPIGGEAWNASDAEAWWSKHGNEVRAGRAPRRERVVPSRSIWSGNERVCRRGRCLRDDERDQRRAIPEPHRPSSRSSSSD